MRPNPYRRPATPQARRAEIMRAAAMRKRAGRRTASRIFEMDFVNSLEKRVEAAISAASRFANANMNVEDAYEKLTSENKPLNRITDAQILKYEDALTKRDRAFDEWQSLNDPIASEISSIRDSALSVGGANAMSAEMFSAYVDTLEDTFGTARDFLEEHVTLEGFPAQELFRLYMGRTYQQLAQEERDAIQRLKQAVASAKNLGSKYENEAFVEYAENYLVAPDYFDEWDITQYGDSRDFDEWRSSLTFLEQQSAALLAERQSNPTEWVYESSRRRRLPFLQTQKMRPTIGKRAGRRTAQLNDGYEDPYDLMMDVKNLAQDLGRKDVFIDGKAMKQLEELEHMVSVGLRWESDEDGEFDIDPTDRSRLEALNKAIDDALGYISELNYTISEVRL